MIDPSEQLEDIAVIIAKAQDSLCNGISIDMTDIQLLVQDVCISIQNNPPADGNRVHEKITSIIIDLNLLSEELKKHQKTLEDEAIKKNYIKTQDET